MGFPELFGTDVPPSFLHSVLDDFLGNETLLPYHRYVYSKLAFLYISRLHSDPRVVETLIPQGIFLKGFLSEFDLNSQPLHVFKNTLSPEEEFAFLGAQRRYFLKSAHWVSEDSFRLAMKHQTSGILPYRSSLSWRKGGWQKRELFSLRSVPVSSSLLRHEFQTLSARFRYLVQSQKIEAISGLAEQFFRLHRLSERRSVKQEEAIPLRIAVKRRRAEKHARNLVNDYWKKRLSLSLGTPVEGSKVPMVFVVEAPKTLEEAEMLFANYLKAVKAEREPFPWLMTEPMNQVLRTGGFSQRPLDQLKWLGKAELGDEPWCQRYAVELFDAVKDRLLTRLLECSRCVLEFSGEHTESFLEAFFHEGVALASGVLSQEVESGVAEAKQRLPITSFLASHSIRKRDLKPLYPLFVKSKREIEELLKELI